MVMRRCPKCGATNDDKYGFCLNCAYEYPNKENINIEGNEVKRKCIRCGYENPEEAVCCVKCGMPLIINDTVMDNGPFIIRIRDPKEDEELEDYNKTNPIIILLGYIFSILGGLLGFFIAIYLSTRKDPTARKHGHIQLAILIFYIVIILIAIGTGTVNMSELYNITSMM